MSRSDLRDYRFGLRMRELGEVISVGDGIAWVGGLPSAALNQLVTFEDGLGSRGMLFNLSEDQAGVILLDESERIASGTRVALAEPELSIPVGDALLGRVVDPLCRPLDGLERPQLGSPRPSDVRAPTIAERDFVHQPLYTGNAVVDTMLPIGRGQRQLLMGDRGLGKTSLALDTVVNQHESGVLCVYVLIGQRRSDVMGVIQTLRASGVMAHCVIVVAEANSLPGLQYVAPYAGCAIAEAWMRAGRHVVIVYDDLTRHAQAYRALSLLLRRPPGREAYPGDIFFLHSRLLERATVLAPALGGGSITALPIVETEEGEIAAYIPTNLISITDGQTVFSQELFSSGYLPAIDVAKSVSRIGGKAQAANVRAEAGRMRLEYLQFLELERFARLGTRLEASTAARLRRGHVLRELLRQERLTPHPISYRLAWMIAFNDGLLSEAGAEDVRGISDELARRASTAELPLDAPRSDWSATVRGWLQGHRS